MNESSIVLLCYLRMKDEEKSIIWDVERKHLGRLMGAASGDLSLFA